jgi:hypothetical protein
MAKASDIINTASVLCGLKAAGEPISGDEDSYGLSMLNAMLDSWQADNLYIPYVTEVIATVTGSPVLIGTGQTINVARPKFIRDTSFIRSGGLDTKIWWLSEADFNEIPVKSATGTFSNWGYYDEAFPIGRIYLYPQPTNSELHLQIDATLPQFADYTTDYDIDTGWLMALYLSLAEYLCIGVREPPAGLMQKAMLARRQIRNNNAQINTLQIDTNLLPGRRGYLLR